MLGLAYALLLVSCLKNVANPDVFWHLSAGRRLLETGAVPRQEWLSFSRAGAAWTDFEWLQQVIWQAVYARAGWWGLIALKTALFALGAWAVERSLRERGADRPARAAAVAALAAGWGTVNDVRADNVTLALFCVTLAALERLRHAERRQPSLRAIGLSAAALGALWANLHGGFALALGAAAVYAVLVPAPARARCAAALAGGALGTLANPFGPSLYGVFFQHARSESAMARLIIEWKWASPQSLATWPFWILAAWSAWAFVKLKPRRADAAPWALLAVLFVAGAAHQRNTALFVTAAALLTASALQGARRLSIPRAAALACVGACGALLAVLPQDVSRSGLRHGKFPEGAAAYLEAHPEIAKLKLYNPWGWGGYLGWRLGPPYRVFFDGRYLFHDLLAEVAAATSDPRSWNAFLDRQGLDGAILSRDQPDMKVRVGRWDGEVREAVFPYEVLFMPPQRWKLVYEDDVSVVYVRKPDARRS